MPSDIIGDGLAVTLQEIVARMNSFAEAIVRDNHGISYSQYHFLASVSALEHRDVTSIAECLVVSKAAVSKRLDGLVADGLITLGSDPGHARRVLVDLTPRAQQIVGDATRQLESEFQTLLHELPPGDADDLTARLRELLAVLIRKQTPAE